MAWNMTRTSRVQPAPQARHYRDLHQELPCLHKVLQVSRPNQKKRFLKRYAIPVIGLYDAYISAKDNRLSCDFSKSNYLPMMWSRQ